MLSQFDQVNKVLITGGSGFLGQSFQEYWFNSNHICPLTPSHKEVDVADRHSLEKYIKKEKPDIIIHAAVAGNSRGSDTYQDFLMNMRMFDNFAALDKGLPTFFFGSGAEFDRTKDIRDVTEEEGLNRWPYDYYGLAKSIQTRRVLAGEFQNAHVLRLFGCFGPLEKNTRFIKSAILNLMKGESIEINQDKYMDFFYVEDVARVIEEILWRGSGPLNVNLVYEKKTKLTDVATSILRFWDRSGFLKVEDKIWYKEESSPVAYTGNGTRLKNTGIKLYGLEYGIGQTLSKIQRNGLYYGVDKV